VADRDDSGDARTPPARIPRRGGQLIIGRLQDHGPANYQFRAREDPSYYVRLLTAKGERILWGKDLERAITEGKTRPKPGELIGARRIAREAVTITARQRDPDGRVITQQEQHAHRTRWEVERVSHFAERARLARRLRDEQIDLRDALRQHPELRSTFLSVRAAEEFAAKRITNPTDRERFLQLVKGAMAASIRQGEPLPSVSLRESKPKESEAVNQPPERKPEEPTR
jgi:hypothetical protein